MWAVTTSSVREVSAAGLGHVEQHLVTHLGPVAARASVTFVGTETFEVLRFDGDEYGVTRYVTLGMSRHPMSAGDSLVVEEDGPRAELVLSLRDRRDDVTRALAVLAASPAVEGVVVTAGASLTLGEPLWPGAGFESVLVGAGGGLLPDLVAPAAVSFFPILPMTRAEAAWKRVHGAAALEERWLTQGIDLRDPLRAAVGLG